MRVPSRVSASAHGVLAGICLILAPSFASGATLVEATLTRTEGEAVLALTAEEPIHYDVFQLTEPDRVVLDLLDTSAPVEPTLTGEDGSGWFGAVRQGLWRDEPDGRVVRYVIETAAPARWGVTAEGNRLNLCLNRSDGARETDGRNPSETSENPLEDAGTMTEAAPVALAEGAAEADPEQNPEEQAEAPRRELDTAPSLGAADPAVSAAVLASPPQSASMNLDVQGADIRTVLRSIAEFGKVNIVPDRDIDGPVSVRLVDVPWRQALDVVCESASLTAVDREDVIRVATRKAVLEEDIDRESAARKHEELLPLETAIITVNYANAEELRRSLGFALSKRGSTEVDARTNSILVTDISDKIAQLRDMVRDLDTETPQVEIVAKLVDVDITEARALGISWNMENMHSNEQRVSGSITHKSPIVGPTTELRLGMVRGFANIDAVIQALESKNKANLLSNPSITTVNNRKARILVGKEVPLVVLDESGNPITELKKVGITLEVTPYINSDGRVTMDLHPEVSDLSSQSTVQGGIVFTTTEADTRVMVNDGETAVIGGLIAQTETRFEQGVPILKSIPFLGGLFRTSDVRKASRELMIFVTPRIVRGSAGIK